MSTSTLEIIQAVCSLVQSIALLISMVILCLIGKNVLALWKEMFTTLCDLRSLMSNSTFSGPWAKRDGGKSNASDSVEENAAALVLDAVRKQPNKTVFTSEWPYSSIQWDSAMSQAQILDFLDKVRTHVLANPLAKPKNTNKQGSADDASDSKEPAGE